MEKVRVGIVGVGWPGQRHIEAYRKLDGVEVVALADLNTELAESVRSEFGLEAEIYEDYEGLFRSSAVDAVSICTPNHLHAPMAVGALELGKHVLLEKPLANTLEEGRRIAETVASSETILMMAFNNRYRPDSRLLKAQIDAGVLGELYYAKAGWLRREWNPIVRGWFTTREMSGGGPLIDLGVHMLDLSLWFMGNPRPVSVSGSVYSKFGERMRPQIGHVDVEDLAAALIKLDNGSTIAMDVSWYSFIEHSDFVYTHLFGTEGGAKLERVADSNDLQIYTGSAGVPLVQSPAYAAHKDPTYQLHGGFEGETAHFVDCIRSGTKPEATVTHGLDVLLILDAIYRSAETGREVVLEEAAPALPTDADAEADGVVEASEESFPASDPPAW